MKLYALLLTAIFTSQAADRIAVQREGSHWKLTVTGSLPAQSVNRIATVGDVTVRGRRSREIGYTVTQNVIAPDEATVRQLARFYHVGVAAGQIVFPQPAAVSIE